MPRPVRVAPAALAVALLLAVGCGGELATEVGPTASAALQSSVEETPVRTCEPRSPTERLATLRRGVDALPAAAMLSARTRLLPQIAAAAQALGQGQSARAAAALREFVGEIVELRLRAPFEERLALAFEAECLLQTVDPATAEGA